MRIISQDGKWDLPYDKIVIDKSGEKIFAQSNLISGGADNYVEIAEYSMPEKAEKAMEMLHEVFNLHEQQKDMEKNKNCTVMMKRDIRALEAKLSDYCFKFPADEEI